MGLVSFLSDKFSQSGKQAQVKQSIYDFKMKAIDGKEIDFSQYRGKKLLIVNTASKCGFTPQYKSLEKLHDDYGDRVTLLGFPANDFLWQEPGNDEEIASFCELNYGVSFQLFSKISVKGRHRAPLYKWLEAKSGKVPTWNFCKYIISEDGESVTFFPSKVDPMNDAILKEILDNQGQ